MNRLPRKISLVTQTTSVLLEEIQAGRWVNTLPGEHALCAQLHVSRKTLRAALKRLEADSVLQCTRGRRRQITGAKPRVVRIRTRRVVLLMPAALHYLNPFVVFLIDRLREHLAEEGCQLDTQPSRSLYRARVPQGLESLSKTLHPAGWVLLHSTEPMQRWFAARQLPCVVVGSRYPGTRLSSVDMDYEAVCLHAVNQFVARGHRCLALINPEPAAAGDSRTAQGFLDAAARKHDAGVQAEVVKHDGTPANICRCVQALLGRPQPPTAFLVSRAHHFLTVMSYVLSCGVRVPGHVALISRENDTYLEAIVPTVARYSQNPTTFAANASRLVMNMIRGVGRIKECRIMPNFIRGETLG